MREVIQDDDIAAFAYGLVGSLAVLPYFSLASGQSLIATVASSALLIAIGVLVIIAHAAAE